MARGKRAAHGRLDPFYIGIIIFIAVILLAVTGGVILAGGFPKENQSGDVSSMVSSYSETSSSVSGVPSEQLEEEGSSSEAEILQGSSMPQQDSSSSVSEQIAGFEEQFAKNQYDADFDKKISEASNNTQILSAYNEYINIWKDEVTNVMEKLSSALDATQFQEIQSQQGEWESTIDAKLEEQFAEIDKNGQGSLGNINRAEITYKSYRDRAKELYKILYEVKPDFTVGKEE